MKLETILKQILERLESQVAPPWEGPEIEDIVFPCEDPDILQFLEAYLVESQLHFETLVSVLALILY